MPMLSALPDDRPLAAGGPAAPQRLLSARLVTFLATGAMGMTSLNLALPILPLTITQTTHDRAAAGIVTAVISACTIVLEVASPGLMRRFQARRLLLGALLLQMVAMAGFAEFRALPAMLVCGAVT